MNPIGLEGPGAWDEYEWDAGIGKFRREVDPDGERAVQVALALQPASPGDIGWSAERALVECATVGVPLSRPVTVVDGRRHHP